MANSPVPPVPYTTPITNQSGVLSAVWASWFRNVFIRIGGLDAPSNSDLSNNSATVTSLSTLQAQVDGLNQGRQL